MHISEANNVVKARFQAPARKVADAVPAICDLMRKHCRKCMAIYAKEVGERRPAEKEKAPREKKAEKKAKNKAKPEAREKAPEREKAQGKRGATARRDTPVLGVVIGKPREEEAAELIRVWEDSPAAKAGLKPGDRIVKLDERQIDSPEQLRVAVLRHKPGDEVNLVVDRDGQRTKLQARLAGGDDFAGRPHRGRLRRLLSPRPWLGVHIGSGAGCGLSVVAVLPGSPADRAGLTKGDAIPRVDKTRVEAPADLQMAIARYRPGETVRLVILRGDARKKIEVELGAFGIWEGEIDDEPRQLLKRFLEGRFPSSEDLRNEREGASSRGTP